MGSADLMRDPRLVLDWHGDLAASDVNAQALRG